MKPISQSGYSLIELIIVIVIMVLAAVPILGQFTALASSTLIDEDIQTAAQLAQERAETVLELRRDQGFAAVLPGTTTEVLAGDYSGYSRSVTVSEEYGPTADCASGATCKVVVISVNRGLARRAEIEYVLMDY